MDSHIFEKIVAESYDAVMVTDKNGIIIVANQATLDSFSLTSDQVIGKTPSQMIEAGYYRNSSVLKVLETGQAVTEVIHINDQQRRFSTSIPLLDEHGEISMVLTNSRSEELLNDFLRKLAYEQEQHTLYKEIATYLSTIRTDTPVYRSEEMAEIISVCDTVADTDSTVMLLGESGVGKEVIAQYLHKMSSRRERAFIPINCAAIPEELFESELFGYTPHAFTGASPKGKMGLLKMAHQGTLFLDEVGELPLTMQTKLLRFLAMGEISPVGSDMPEKVDVRIITATNQDLLAMTREKTFRLDLYYRLNVIPIRIPPLRERKDDVDILTVLFLEQYNHKYKKQLIFDEGDMAAMRRYDWPGNVRELRNVVERTVVMCKPGGNIHKLVCKNLGYPDQPLGEGECGMEQRTGDGFQIPFDLPLKQALEQFEDYYVGQVLEQQEGGLSQAAKTLDIHRTTLYRKQRAPKPSQKG